MLADWHASLCLEICASCQHLLGLEQAGCVQASAETLKEMERCARQLARSVGYVGAATVEYLYDLTSAEYYFLELNPRLQVHAAACMIHGIPSEAGRMATPPDELALLL